MARFVSLIWRGGGVVAVMVLAAGSIALRAQQPPAMSASTNTVAVAKPPARTPATNAPTLGQYGKILAPGDQPGHPLKLKLPFPDAGQVKIPSQDELTMRDKLEKLAELSDADIRMQLSKWPAYGNMSLRDQGALLQRIQDFRDFRTNVAKSAAHDMGLLTLAPDQFAKFEKEYWDKRLAMDNDLAKQFTPIYKARAQKVQDDLYREFSALSPVPSPPQPKPAPPAGGPAGAANKPAPLASAGPTNGTSMTNQPMAQAPR